MSTRAERIVSYLKRIAPQGASISEIDQAVGIHSHQTVYKITHQLKQAGKIHGAQGLRGEREWVFYATTQNESPLSLPNSTSMLLPEEMTPARFEVLAARIMGDYYKLPLYKGSIPGVHKEFDLVSVDHSVVGDAKFFTLVRGAKIPPAKFSVIAEHCWLLEKVNAQYKFLVFGNQKEVPLQWLRRYGNLVHGVSFFFISDQEIIEKLN